MEKAYDIDIGKLVYEVQNQEIIIKKYRGIATHIEIPSTIEGLPVTVIEKKAFLSCKTIKEIILPETIKEVRDWAFAHATHLDSVIMPKNDFIRGKDLFLGCNRLKEIYFGNDIEQQKQDCADGIPVMLSAAVTIFHDYFLFQPSLVRSDNWVSGWDNKLLQLTDTDDLDGFEELWTCGEEDYEGKDYDIKTYPVEKRKVKLRLVYFRLLHPFKLSEQVRQKLQLYLKVHTKGTSKPQAWDIILNEHREDISYYRVFTEAGCVTEENFDEILEDMSQVNAEIKAFMFRYQTENLKKKDAFASFELDW